MIDVVEVSPRDGLQNEPVHFSTPEKQELIARLVAAGARRIEVASFVNPKRVPQMADSDALVAALPRLPTVSYIGLVMNRRGLERAIAAGVHEANVVLVATDTMGRRNQGQSIADSLATWEELAPMARKAGLRVTATIGVAFGCPFEGEVPVERVAAIASELARHAPDDLTLADTIGVAAPSDVTAKFSAVARACPGVRLRAHFHNTRNTGLANALAAVQAGVGILDASLGGIGGCPFAPAATGNIPTEDLAYMLHRMGEDTGLDLPALLDAAAWLQAKLGRPVPALLGKAGLFPKAA